MAKPTEVTTKPVRLSYPHLFEPKAKSEGGAPVYQAQLLLPPSFDIAPLRAAMAAAVKDKFGDKTPPKERMAPYGNPLRKMEEKQDAETGEFPKGWEAGGHFLGVANKYQPTVVDRKAQVIKDPNLVYPGCWVQVHLNAYAWDFKGKWGVSFSLEAVQFVRDDERFDGRRPATDIFKPLEGETPPAAAGEATSDQDALFG